MEIAFVIVIAAALGLGIRFLVPGWQSHGLLLVPSAAAAAAAAAWAILVWLGFTFDGGWIWIISVGVGVAAALLVAFLIPGRRERADERFFETARRGG